MRDNSGSKSNNNFNDFKNMPSSKAPEIGNFAPESSPYTPVSAAEPGTPEAMFFYSQLGGKNEVALFARIIEDLKYQDWKRVIQAAELIITYEPRNPGAYLARLMAQRGVSKVDDLGTVPLLGTDYNRALDCSNDEQRSYLETLKGRIDLENAYKNAVLSLRMAHTPEACRLAEEEFVKLNGYKDSLAQIEICKEKAVSTAESIARAEKDRKRRTLIKTILIVVTIIIEIAIPAYFMSRNATFVGAIFMGFIPMFIVGYLMVTLILKFNE